MIRKEQSQSTNKNEWDLSESEYMEYKPFELIPLLMKSLNIDPMAYPKQHNKSGLKKDLHTQGVKLYPKIITMKLRSFSTGKGCPWIEAKNNNLIKEA